MRRKRVAVLMASIDREYQTDFVHGVFAAAAERGIDVCIFNCQGHLNVDVSVSDVGESAIFDLAMMGDFDGIISLRETLADEVSLRKVEETLRALGDKPHVSIDLPTNRGVGILFDDAVSVRQMTEHLIEKHGARRIVCLSGPLKQLVAMTRVQACREVMAAHGLALTEKDVFEGEWIHSSGIACAHWLMERNEPLPDAVVCGNDDMAFGLTETLLDHGIRVPEDVMVTGFDALREAVARGMSTIRRPIDQAAHEALRVLAEWMDGKKPENGEVLLPTIPIFGESCGCAANHQQTPARSRLFRNQHRRAESTLLQVSMFNGALASVMDEEDAGDKLDQFVRTMDIHEMYLCVNPALTREIPAEQNGFAYPERMMLLYGHSGDLRIPSGLFPTADTVPVMGDERDKPLALVFCPLYYRDRNFGYLAIEMGPATGLALYSVLMLLNGSLMSLYLQTSLRKYAAQVEEMSVHDIMTGMLNRRGFMEKSPALLDQARREGRYFVMLSADMDFMKRINDRYGHLTGDQAICRMGRAMEKLQAQNMKPVHISGDEFLAYGLADSAEEAGKTLDAAREALCELNAREPWIVETSASFGLYAAIPAETDSIDTFLTRADRAMYEEKNRKKKAAADAARQ